MKELKFSVTGEGYTNLVRNFIQEFNLHKAFQLLQNLPLDMKLDFLKGKKKFIGDTNVEPDLFIVKDNWEFDLPNLVYYLLIQKRPLQLREYLGSEDRYVPRMYKNDKELLSINVDKYKDLEIFCQYMGIPFDLDSSNITNWLTGVQNEKWLSTLNKGDSGVILKNGRVLRFGYAEHDYIQRELSNMGLDDGSYNSYDSIEVIRFSSRELNGNLWNNIKFLEEDGFYSDAQLHSLFKLRKELTNNTKSNTVTKILFNEVVYREGYGLKWGGLKFLMKYFPEYKYPKIYKGDKYKFLRTSLFRQYAGVIDSGNTREEILKDWSKLPEEVTLGNECYIFSQKFIKGKQHTCQYFNEKYTGKSKWKEFVLDLSKDLDKDIQLELVNDTIVEIKLFDKQLISSYDEDRKPDYKGICFSKGKVQGTVGEDIMVVSNDSKHPNLLVGKKALLVEKNPKFSHILCLAKHLNIPAVYNVGTMTYGEKIEINNEKIYKV